RQHVHRRRVHLREDDALHAAGEKADRQAPVANSGCSRGDARGQRSPRDRRRELEHRAQTSETPRLYGDPIRVAAKTVKTITILRLTTTANVEATLKGSP